MAAATEKKPLQAATDLRSEQQGERIFKRVLLDPAVIVILVFSIFPLVWALGVSFTSCQRTVPAANAEEEAGFGLGDLMCLGNPAELSLTNYQRVPNDQRLLNAAGNTLYYVIFGVAVQYVIGFGLAILLNQDIIGRQFFRLIFLLPMMLTPVAVGYVGRMMFDSGIAPLAQLLRNISRFFENNFGMELELSIPWLTSTDVAPITIILMDSWQWIPFMMLLLLAGMQAIPDEIYEAARVDGANSIQIFFGITFPIMLPISLTAILIRCLEMFKIIDVINVTTGGGPGGATESLVMYVFDTALSFGNYGYASAIGIVLLLMVIIFALILLGVSQRVIKHRLGI